MCWLGCSSPEIHMYRAVYSDSDSEGHATSALADMFPVSGQCPVSGEQPELPAGLGEGRVD